MTVRHTGSGFPAVFCWRYSRVMSGDDDVVLMTLSGQPLASESELNVQISAPQNHTLILTDKRWRAVTSDLLLVAGSWITARKASS